MQDLVISGAGGFGREAALMIRQINEKEKHWNVTGFYDDHIGKGETVDGLPVLGGIAELNEISRSLAVVLAIANPAVRKRIRGGLKNSNLYFPVLIHPSVNQGDIDRNTIGEGTIITAGNILTTNIHLGSFVIVNLACTIGHDVKVGDFSAIMPGCSLSGFIDMGEEVFMGSGARILPGIQIGHRSSIGAGAVVTKPVAEGVTVVGIPAKELV